MFRYRSLADEIEGRIRRGIYKPGERLPSLRKLHRDVSISVTTAYQAYMELEAAGLVEARERSGFFVSPVRIDSIGAPVHPDSSPSPLQINLSAMVNSVITAMNDPKILPLGSSVISSDLLPAKALSRIMKRITSREMEKMISYTLTEGYPKLRHQIAIRHLGILANIIPDDIVITNGCMEAVSLALRAVVKPGDTVAIESPTMFGFLQMLAELGLYAVEIPTDPATGVDPDRVETILSRGNIKACLFIPNFHNPLGSVMPDENKEKLVGVLNRFNVPGIEDEIYAELHHGEIRPKPLKAFDRNDRIITCSSFSKTVSPGLRIGWIIPGKMYIEKVKSLKGGMNVSTSTLDQHLIASFLEENGFERHLKQLRNRLKKQVMQTAFFVKQHFPGDIRLALPKGGSLLWVQLDRKSDGLKIAKQALKNKISVLPGEVCSASGKFKNYLRIGCGQADMKRVENGIKLLGEIIGSLQNR